LIHYSDSENGDKFVAVREWEDPKKPPFSLINLSINFKILFLSTQRPVNPGFWPPFADPIVVAYLLEIRVGAEQVIKNVHLK
jgi:hypothetical protein